jgi:hypothetical protein
MDDIISINDVKIIMDSDEEWENISINDTKDVTNSEIEVTKSEIDLTNDEIYLTKGEIEFTKGDISYMKMDTNDNIVVYTLLRIAKKNIEEDKIEDDPTNEMIIKCLEISNLSYDDNIRHKEFNNSKFNNVRLYIERKEDKMIISIRGTVTMYDIVNDIDCFQEKMDEEELIKENLLVHNGFYKDFKEIKKYKEYGIEEEELNFTKSSLTQSEALKYESPFQKAGFLKRISDYNLNREFSVEQAKVLKEISRAEINKLAAEKLPYDKMIVTIVGDKSKVLEDETKKSDVQIKKNLH